MAVAVGMALLSSSACHSSPSPPSASLPAHLNNSTGAPDGGGVRVVESAFQAAEPRPGTGETNRALVAIVLENTSKRQQSQDTRLTIELFDGDGRSLFEPGGSPATGPTIGTPVIPPGGRIGVGAILVTSDDAARHRVPVRIDIRVGGSDWRQPNDKPEIRLHDAAVTPRPDGTTDLTYTAEVPDLKNWASVQIPSVSILFRDSTGKLLGGAALGHSVIPSWTVGTSSRLIRFTAQQWKDTVPTGADLTRTEVYGSIDGG